MKNQKGIWIDSKKAIVVTLNDGQREMKTFESGIVSQEREAGESKSFTRMGAQFMTSEKKDERKHDEQSKKFVHRLLPEIKDSSEVVVFGPSNMKHILVEEIKEQYDLVKKLKGVENADSMTDNQVGAWVDDYFNK